MKSNIMKANATDPHPHSHVLEHVRLLRDDRAVLDQRGGLPTKRVQPQLQARVDAAASIAEAELILRVE